MGNYEIMSKMETCSEFNTIEKHMFSLHCINDNIRLLAEGFAFNDEDEKSNALMLCADTLSVTLRDLSECIDRLDMQMTGMGGDDDSDKD